MSTSIGVFLGAIPIGLVLMCWLPDRAGGRPKLSCALRFAAVVALASWLVEFVRDYVHGDNSAMLDLSVEKTLVLWSFTIGFGFIAAFLIVAVRVAIAGRSAP